MTSIMAARGYDNALNIYPNRPAPVVVQEGGERIVR
jgi:hypothetical protein